MNLSHYLHSVPDVTFAQISFARDADMGIIRRQLEAITKQFPYMNFMCGFLSRQHILEKEALDPTIVDLLDEVLGSKIFYASAAYKTVSQAITNIDRIRVVIKDHTRIQFVLGVNIAPGVSQEITLRSNSSVFILPVN